MYHIIEAVYYPYGAYYQLFMPIIVIAAAILFVVSIIFVFRRKKPSFLIFAAIFAFIIYQGVPYYYTAKALRAKADADIIINYEKAAKTACFSAHKGFIYADIASYFFMKKDGMQAIKYFNSAYKYLKNYKSIWAWGGAPFVYILNSEYDKAILIASETEEYSIASSACILKEDYIAALDFINRALDKNPDNVQYYSQRAVIYKNLNKTEQAENDYHKALKLCRYSNLEEQIKNSYGNYNNFYKKYYEQKRIEYGFTNRNQRR